MSSLDITNFVASFMLGEEHTPMTYEDARYTFDEWVKEGMELPEGLTPEIFADEWNGQIEHERSMIMNSKESKTRMVTPCDVTIRRFYRMYVTTDKDAGADEVRAAARQELMDANDPDALLTPDPDLDIEIGDIEWISPDEDGSWWDDEDAQGVKRNAATPREAERASKMKRIAKSAMNMIRIARPERKIVIEYVKPTDHDIERYTEWERKRNALRTGDEYFLVWDTDPHWDTDRADLLYAVNVSIDSLLTAAYELLELLHRKF